jgi:hypothetical protein
VIVYHTLKSVQGQLEIFASAIPATQEEIQKQETTITKVINIESIGSPESLRSPQDGQHLQDVTGTEEDILIRDYGQVEYDPFNHSTVRVPYEEDGHIKTCRWVKYDLQGPNPMATGTEGLMRVYEVNFHANPHPAPNYTELHHFCNDALQIFHPTMAAAPWWIKHSHRSGTLAFMQRWYNIDSAWQNVMTSYYLAVMLPAQSSRMMRSSSPALDCWLTPEVLQELALPSPLKSHHLSLLPNTSPHHPNLDPLTDGMAC